MPGERQKLMKSTQFASRAGEDNSVKPCKFLWNSLRLPSVRPLYQSYNSKYVFNKGTECALYACTIFLPSHPTLKERANVPIFTPSRYITILFFLNNVTEGGETAFPVADREELFVGKNYSTNLSRNCNRGSLVVKPVEGSALLWYNNVLDEESGKMGEVDMLTLHGGCDVIEGEKWIANLWLNAPRGDQTV